MAQARKLSADQVKSLIEQYTEGPDLGFLGEPGVNVLRLNLALDGRETGDRGRENDRSGGLGTEKSSASGMRGHKIEILRSLRSLRMTELGMVFD